MPNRKGQKQKDYRSSCIKGRKEELMQRLETCTRKKGSKFS